MAIDMQAPLEQQPTVEQQLQQLRELFAEAPEVGRKAFENVLKGVGAAVDEFLDKVGD